MQTKKTVVRLNIPIKKEQRNMAKIAALKAGIDLKDFVVQAIIEKIDNDLKKENKQ